MYNSIIYQWSQVCGWSSSGRRYGNLSLQQAGRSLWTSPADLYGLYITQNNDTDIKILHNSKCNPQIGIYNLPSVNFILTCLNISTGQFTRCAEMDSDEFTLFDRAQFVASLYIVALLQVFS